MARHSHLAFVLVKLKIELCDHFLFIKHPKWGDWGFVGGHVEPGEEEHWELTAIRDVEEDLAPLRSGVDFELTDALGAPVRWGPVPSRSAGGLPTLYEARYFALRFLRNPVGLLWQLAPNDFLLVPIERLVDGRWGDDIADTLSRLAEAMPRGLRSAPASCPHALRWDETDVWTRRSEDVSQ